MVILLFFALSAALALALSQPGYYRIQRSIQIKEPLPKIYAYVLNLENRTQWLPWELKDNEIRIKEAISNQRISFEMTSHHSNKQSTSDILFVEVPAGTIVTWGMDGRNESLQEKFFYKWKSFKRKLEQDFDQGLSQLKKAIETK